MHGLRLARRPRRTTTLPTGGPCADLTGIARLCADAMPTRLDAALRARLERAASRFDVAAASEGRQRARSLKKAFRPLTTVERKATRASTSKKPAKRISAACAGEIGLLVSAVKVDAS